MTSETLTQKDRTFFPTLGPFFVDATVREATGSSMTSTPDQRWTVIRDGKKVQAFATYTLTKSGNADFQAVYAPGGNDAKRQAVEAATEDARSNGARLIRVAAKLANAEFYRALGFESGALRGGFITLQKALS